MGIKKVRRTVPLCLLSLLHFPVPFCSTSWPKTVAGRWFGNIDERFSLKSRVFAEILPASAVERLSRSHQSQEYFYFLLHSQWSNNAHVFTCNPTEKYTRHNTLRTNSLWRMCKEETWGQVSLKMGFLSWSWELGCKVMTSRHLPSDRRISDFRLPISDFWFLISVFRFPISVFRFRISDFGFRITDFGFRISVFGSQKIPAINFLVLIHEIQKTDWPQSFLIR